ncbi:MAG: tetratricopeptide repeat protein [Porcipelethomonas sp.]
MKLNMVRVCVFVIAAAVIICGCLTAVILNDKSGNSELYREKLISAKSYVEKGDYNAALKAYLEAIDADENEVAPYMYLAELYHEVGMLDDAIKILERGYKVTGSEKIRELLKQYEMERDSAASENGSDSEASKEKNKAEKESPVVLNASMLNMTASSTYKDYLSDHSVSESSQGDFGTKIVFAGINREMYFYNTSQNNNKVDSSTGMPEDEARPNYIKLADISELLTGMPDDGITYEELSSLELSGFKRKKDSETGKNVVEFKNNGCVVIIETDDDGNITSKKAWNKIILPEQESASKTTVYFSFNDASSGEAIKNADVKFYASGSNQIVAECRSGNDGICSAELMPGKYDIMVTADEYADYTSNFEVSGYEDVEPVKINMSSSMTEGQMRIVLTWGENPRDLDSYLFYTNSSGKSVRLYYGNKSEPEADLDIDDMDGNGPETITIKDLNGVYYYDIQDYRKTGMLGESNARVTVYKGNKMIGEYEVNAEAENNWSVLKIDNGTVTFVNVPDARDSSSSSK